jgi:hypothetical protein
MQNALKTDGTHEKLPELSVRLSMETIRENASMIAVEMVWTYVDVYDPATG